jgi:predicted SAM-dependent methyltransferase
MFDLRSRALSGINISIGRGLEIGPLNRPLLPKSPGRIFYADHCSTEDLRTKYANNPEIPKDDICLIDFDLSRMRLSDTNKDGQFDLVVASHVIEHVPDLVSWLRDIHGILNDGGVLALVVPDKRFTFDVFRRETSFWMVQEAVGRSRPSIEVVIDHFMNNVHADAATLWAVSESRNEFRRTTNPGAYLDLIERYNRGEYIDAHCWVVTPRSFLELIGQIIDYYKIPYELSFFETTPLGKLEFYVQLRKSFVKTNWAARAKQAELEVTAPISGLLKVAWKAMLRKRDRFRNRFLFSPKQRRRTGSGPEMPVLQEGAIGAVAHMIKRD